MVRLYYFASILAPCIFPHTKRIPLRIRLYIELSPFYHIFKLPTVCPHRFRVISYN